jgi:hypothetical protein
MLPGASISFNQPGAVLLKKEITYQNPFTEQEVTEEHYFHISKADLVEMEMEEHNFTYNKDGETLTGMQAKLQRIVDSQDGKAIMTELKELIRRSYGKKEGDRFLKSPEIWNDFVSTEAFSQLLFELCTDAGSAAEFMNGVVPSNLEQVAAEIREKAERVRAETDGKDNVPPMGPRPAVSTKTEEPRVLTRAEAVEMDSDELQSGLATGRYKLS